MKSKIAITGIGSYIPKFGFGVEKLYNAVFNQQSLISSMPTKLELDKRSSKVGGFCDESMLNKDLESFWENQKDHKRMDKFLKLSIIAASEAVESANLLRDNFYNKSKIGSIIGTGIGGMEGISRGAVNFENFGQKKISPFLVPFSIANMASSLVSMKYGLTGPNYSVSSACASGNNAIISGVQLIELGICDAVVVGGSESICNEFGIACFDVMHALSSKFNETPEKASRPMDKNRDGFVMSEGCGVLVLENYEKAKQRGANILGEIAGYGMSGVVTHITAPDEEGLGAFNAMQNAVEYGNIDKKEISLVNMHATSTPLGDVIEAKAVLNYFGKDNHPALSATKNITGHMIGAISAIELIITLESLNRQICPANMNLDEPEDIILSLNMKKEEQVLKNACFGISNSFGFGGTNSSIIVKKN